MSILPEEKPPVEKKPDPPYLENVWRQVGMIQERLKRERDERQKDPGHR